MIPGSTLTRPWFADVQAEGRARAFVRDPTERRSTSQGRIVRGCGRRAAATVSSGTEARMSAIRSGARSHRRDGIIKFEGCYTGIADACGQGRLQVTGLRPPKLGRSSSRPDSPHDGARNKRLPADRGRLYVRTDPGIACARSSNRWPENRNMVPQRRVSAHAARLCTRHGALLVFGRGDLWVRFALGVAQ